MQIPFFSLARQWDLLGPAIGEKVQEVLASGKYIGGPYVASLEQQLAQYLGVEHAIGCNSGTDALWLALKTLNVQKNDIVLTTPFSFVASSSEIVAHGGLPVFIDVQEDTFNLCPKKLVAWLEQHTSMVAGVCTETTTGYPVRGILAVNIFGQCPDYATLETIAQEKNLWIVEDAAQSIGAHIDQRMSGTFGDISCFSFYPTKNLGAFGDGGAITTNNKQLAETIRTLCAHGRVAPYRYGAYGLNSRLDAIQAVILQEKLLHIDKLNEKRRAIAQHYEQMLGSLPGLRLPKQLCGHHVYHQFSLEIVGDSTESNRDALRAALNQAEIGTNIFYPQIFTDVPYLNTVAALRTNCPVAQRFSKTMLQLPIWPELTKEELSYIGKTVTQFICEGSLWPVATTKAHHHTPEHS